MALIKCIECGKDVSSKAATCPNCGYPLQNIDKEVTLEEKIDYLVNGCYMFDDLDHIKRCYKSFLEDKNNKKLKSIEYNNIDSFEEYVDNEYKCYKEKD